MTSPAKKIMIVFGTRPEAIKLAPVIHGIRDDASLGLTVVSTNQHTEMLEQTLTVFDIKPDHELRLMEKNQSLLHITERGLRGLTELFRIERPDFVVVQGDTTTAFVGGLASFYEKVPVGHVEAGLRTGDKHSPYPEEMNRRLVGCLADLHFAPTERARQNLLEAGVAPASIMVTGNTVVDALRMVRDRAVAQAGALAYLPDEGQRLILVTAHRRESFGAPMERICDALREICERVPAVTLVFPVHLNPNLRATIMRALKGVPRLHLTDPVDYLTMVGLLVRAHLVLTDSGGVQEEATALGRPTLVLREKTERIEGIEAGVAKLVGTDTATIVRETLALLNDAAAHQRMAQASACYGDGRGAERIVDALRTWSGP